MNEHEYLDACTKIAAMFSYYCCVTICLLLLMPADLDKDSREKEKTCCEAHQKKSHSLQVMFLWVYTTIATGQTCITKQGRRGRRMLIYPFFEMIINNAAPLSPAKEAPLAPHLIGIWDISKILDF